MNEFKKLGLSEKIVKIVDGLGLTKPTEIQEKTIPLSLEGKDIIGSSATGSGKTLAFGLGMIEKMEKGKGPQALILTPTRELADQITKVFKTISRDYNLKVTEVYGGVSISGQIRNIPESEIIIGTPGRVLDHLERRTLNLSKLKVLVLDEADRMSDMGFLDDVEKIINRCPDTRQTLLFTATISSDIGHIAKRHMKSPVSISVESYVDASKLHQVYYDVPRNIKFSLLVHLLKEEGSNLVMVFCNTRMNSDMLADNLGRYGLHAKAIHGGLDQKKRNRLMEDFHRGEVRILVCTDVAARGLDIKGISHVYNYDIPKTSAEYIHRVGRTARAGKEGMAVSIVTDKDYDNFRRVLQDPSLKIERKDAPEVESLHVKFNSSRDRDSGRGRSSGRFGGRRDSGSSGFRGRSSGRDRGRSPGRGSSGSSSEFRSRDSRGRGGSSGYGRSSGRSSGFSRGRR